MSNYFENTNEAFPLVGLNICLSKMANIVSNNKISNFFPLPNAIVKYEDSPSNGLNNIISIESSNSFEHKENKNTNNNDITTSVNKKRKIEIINLYDD